MDKIISIIVATDNIEFSESLVNEIKEQQDMTTICVVYDGEECLKEIKDKTPDLVILDVIMPKIDGMGVLEELNEINPDKRPYIIMASEIGQEEITNKALKLGASYYMIRPFQNKVLFKRIRDLFNPNQYIEYKKNNDRIIEDAIVKRFNDYNMPKLNGYYYLKEAVLMAIKDESILESITKSLYPAIAEIYNVKVTNVEKDMRKAIELAYKDGYLSEYIEKKPTNGEFIAIVSYKIKTYMI